MDQADLPRSTEAAAQATMADSRMQVKSWPLTIMVVLAVFYTLYFASEIVLPFVLALVLNLLLAPAMRFMTHRLKLPKHLAALVLILLLFGFIGMIGLAISVPASGWIAKAPESLPALQHKFAFLHKPMTAIQNGLQRVQGMMSGGGHTSSAGGVSGGGGGASLAGVGTTILSGTKFFLGEIFTLVLVLFFLLASGDSLLRRFVEIMPTLADKRRTVQIVSEIEHNVSLYLATITVMNVAVGLLNMAQVWLFGLPNPLLWGVVAFMLNYIPILGPLTGIVIFFFVGLFTFNSVVHALIPPAIYLAIHLLEGETITPMLLARRFTLNPLLVIASLMFWDWLWGIPGAFLSVPMLAVFKIICDHVDSLTPLGHMLGDAPQSRKATASAARA